MFLYMCPSVGCVSIHLNDLCVSSMLFEHDKISHGSGNENIFLFDLILLDSLALNTAWAYRAQAQGPRGHRGPEPTCTK